MPSLKHNIEIFDRTVLFNEDSDIILTEKFNNCVFQISFDYTDVIEVAQINFVNSINPTISAGISIILNSCLLTFGSITSTPFLLDIDAYNLTLNNQLTLFVDMINNNMYFEINHIVLPYIVSNIPHTMRQIKIVGKRLQIITVSPHRYLNSVPDYNVHFVPIDCQLFNRRRY